MAMGMGQFVEAMEAGHVGWFLGLNHLLLSLSGAQHLDE